jgi:hypothetical protein
MFVLSGTDYGEMLKMKDPARRREIANVMEELTGFATDGNPNVASQTDVPRFVVILNCPKCTA